MEGWVDLGTTAKVCSPCPRTVAAVAVNTTARDVIQTWVLSTLQSDALTTRPLRRAVCIQSYLRMLTTRHCPHSHARHHSNQSIRPACWAHSSKHAAAGLQKLQQTDRHHTASWCSESLRAYTTATWRVRTNHLGQSVDAVLAIHGQFYAEAWCSGRNRLHSNCSQLTDK